MLMDFDPTSFTDNEVAALTFALERFADNLREENYTQEFRREANEVAQMVSDEYKRRNLHFSQFQHQSL